MQNNFNKINYKKSLILLGLAGLMSVTLTGCEQIKQKLEERKQAQKPPAVDKDGKPIPPPPPPPKPINITTANAELQNIFIKESAIGEIQGELPPKPVVINSVTEGVVEKTLPESTSKIVRGQLLLKIKVDNTLELLKDDLQNSVNRLRDVADQTETLSRQYVEARGRLGAVNNEIANRTLLSSISGTVTKRMVKEGDVVKTRQALYEVQPNFTPDTHIKITFPFAKESRVQQDNRILFNLRTNPDEKLEGRITSVKPQGKYRMATVSIPYDGKMEKVWTPQKSVDGEVVIIDKKDALVIPAEAVKQNDKKQSYVFVLPAGKDKVEERIIETGEKAGDKGEKIEVTKGLKDGESVVTSNLDQLKTGTLVAVQAK